MSQDAKGQHASSATHRGVLRATPKHESSPTSQAEPEDSTWKLEEQLKQEVDRRAEVEVQVKVKLEDLHGAEAEPHQAEARVNDRSTKEGLKCEETSPEGEQRREENPGCQRNPEFPHLASRAKEPPAPGARGWGTAGPHAGERSGPGPVS